MDDKVEKKQSIFINFFKSNALFAALILFLFIGSYFLVAAVFALAVLALKEFFQAVEKADVNGRKIKPSFKIGCISVSFLYIATFIFNLIYNLNEPDWNYDEWDDEYGMQEYVDETVSSSVNDPNSSALEFLDDIISYSELVLPVWLIGTFILCFCLMVRKDRDFTDGIYTFFGIFYVGFLIYWFFIYTLYGANSRSFTFAILVTIAALVMKFFEYIFDYLEDKNRGKSKVSPKISGRKYFKLSFIIICLLLVACTIVTFIIAPEYLLMILILGAICCIAAKLAIWCSAAIKKHLGISEFGSIIPGYGGILDKIASLMFIVPVASFLQGFEGFLIFPITD